MTYMFVNLSRWTIGGLKVGVAPSYNEGRQLGQKLINCHTAMNTPGKYDCTKYHFKDLCAYRVQTTNQQTSRLNFSSVILGYSAYIMVFQQRQKVLSVWRARVETEVNFIGCWLMIYLSHNFLYKNWLDCRSDSCE